MKSIALHSKGGKIEGKSVHSMKRGLSMLTNLVLANNSGNKKSHSNGIRAIYIRYILLLFLIFGPFFASGGHIKPYVDKNGNGKYDSGEGIPANRTVWIKSTTGAIINLKTKSSGKVFFSRAQAGDTIFCRQWVFSYTAARSKHDNLPLFNLYFDTFKVTTQNGNTTVMKERTLTIDEAQKINSGRTVYIELTHPVWEWNLLMALDWNPSISSTDYQDIEAGIISASNYLFDVTDGHMKIGRVNIWRNVPQSDALFKKYADVQVYNNNSVWPWSGIGGWNNGASIKMGRSLPASPPQSGWWTTLVHEIGHYCFGFSDEYYDGEGNQADWGAYRTTNPQEVPDNYGLMDNNFLIPELSSHNDYLVVGSYAGKTIKQMTAQIWWHNIVNDGLFHIPCWMYLLDNFNNRSGLLSKWDGYDGYHATIAPPPGGIFRGRDASGVELRTSSDRDGPDNFFPYRIGSNAVWSAAQISPYTFGVSKSNLNVATVVVKPNNLTPVNSDLLSWNKSQPELVLSTSIKHDTKSKDAPVILKISIHSFEKYNSPPSVVIKPDFGTPVKVTVAPKDGNVYDAVVHTYISDGVIEISTNDSLGKGTAFYTYHIDQLPAQFPKTPFILQSYNGLFSLQISNCQNVQPGALAIILSGGRAKAFKKEKSELQPVTEIISYDIEGANQACPIKFTWRFPERALLGRDPENLKIFRWNPITKEIMGWSDTSFKIFPIPFGKNMLLVNTTQMTGTYCIFASHSNDMTSPDSISDLTAKTGNLGKSVILNWTATGDDGKDGIAFKYRLYFSNKPISSVDSVDIMEYPVRMKPGSSGTMQTLAVEMPRHDTMYYFYIQVQDEAGNLSQRSNIVLAKSHDNAE